MVIIKCTCGCTDFGNRMGTGPETVDGKPNYVYYCKNCDREIPLDELGEFAHYAIVPGGVEASARGSEKIDPITEAINLKSLLEWMMQGESRYVSVDLNSLEVRSGIQKITAWCYDGVSGVGLHMTDASQWNEEELKIKQVGEDFKRAVEKLGITRAEHLLDELKNPTGTDDDH